VACARLGRRFIGIEIEEKYFDIAVERIDREYSQGKLF
jgi:DNA modification methylase